MTSTSPGAVGTTSDSSIRRGPDGPQDVHRLDHATGRCAACGQIAPCPAASEAALSLVRLGGQEPSPPVLAGVATVSVSAPAPHLTSGTATPVWPG